MKKKYSQIKIGILGGGQLARMMILEGHKMGLQMAVLSASDKDPAAQVTGLWQKGNPNNKKDLISFLKTVDVATFESEFLNAKLLNEAKKQTSTKIYPAPQLMGRLQDRLSQKKLLEKHKLPTSPFIEVSSTKDLEKAFQVFKKAFVLKKRRFGYDGYGTFIIKNRSQLEKVKPLIKTVKEGFIAEEFIAFKRELAISFVRNSKGDIITLPLVESLQKEARCFWVKGPIKNNKSASLIKKISGFLKNTYYVGTIAFELFDTPKGLMVNEVAPRVHNSAHYSLDALSENQFDLHLKAILNAPLKPISLLKPGFAMLNLLGASNKVPLLSYPKETYLHWYGKSENRPGRKMGHINALDTTPQKALNRLLKIQKEFRL